MVVMNTENMQYKWPKPKRKDVGLTIDHSLYRETLEYASRLNAISVTSLIENIPLTLRKRLIVDRQSTRGMSELVRELSDFDWIRKKEEKVAGPLAQYELTQEGADVLEIARQDQKRFVHLLADKVQLLYTIPGWFVERLWKINPSGQGEVVIPAPSVSWKPSSREWKNSDWDDDLSNVTIGAAKSAIRAVPKGFPIEEKEWLERVRDEWERQSKLQPRRGYDPLQAHYQPRRRLSLAMKSAIINLLFNAKPYLDEEFDIEVDRASDRPIHLRSYITWLSRLEALELIFYTDWHPNICGRLIFPTSVFRSKAPTEKFVRMANIYNPKNEPLWIHQPKWEDIQERFISTLIKVHQARSRRVGVMYVSLLDVRDEVCRLLRLSSLSFQNFLEKAYNQLPTDSYQWSIGVATDVREEESSGYGQLRHPVWIHGIPHSLIAIGDLSHG